MRRSRGFTLIELLVVVAIIGLLLALIVPTAGRIIHQTQVLVCRGHLQSVHQLLMAYAERNGGMFPGFHPYYGAGIFHPASRGVPYDVIMSDAVQLKRMGATAEMWFCPLDPAYRSGSWRWNTWSSKQYTAASGYAVLINRQVTWVKSVGYGTGEPARFTDGRPAPASTECDDDVPLMADNLRYRSDGYFIGWHHGRNGYGDSGHTLFRGGQVVYTEWPELDRQGPGLIMGPSHNDIWWFWLGD